jgi:Histidine kinase
MSDPLDAAALRNRLHNGLCQQLTGALMFARVLSDELEKRDDQLTPDSQTLLRMLDDAANEVHALMREFEPGQPISPPTADPARVDGHTHQS